MYQGRPVEMRECSVNRFGPTGLIVESRMYFARLGPHRQLGIGEEAQGG